MEPPLGTATNAWSPLPEDGFIEHDCLATPLPVKALLDATASDDAVVRALKARGNRVIREIQAEAKSEGFAEGKSEGRAEGLAEALVSILEIRGLAMPPEARLRIFGCRDLETLQHWTQRALSIDSVDDLVSD